MNNFDKIKNNGIYRSDDKHPKAKKDTSSKTTKEYRIRKSRDRKSLVPIDYSTFKGTIQKIPMNKSGIKSKSVKKIRYTKELNDNVPKSEVWFRGKIEKEWFFDILRLKYNHPFKRFIYDAYSGKYQLAIEVDGSIHDLYSQKKKDKVKDHTTAKYGIKMIRVDAYNNVSYNTCIKEIEEWLRKRKVTKYSHNKIVEVVVLPILRKTKE